MIQNVKLKHFVLLMMAVLTGLMIWPGCAEEPPPPAPKKPDTCMWGWWRRKAAR
jgi:hypothetical protein